MLEILPENGLDRSILLPVLVGLGFTTLFTETLGWTFVALVVPGYLSAVFIAAPVSALVMVGEAVATYLLTRLIGIWLPQKGSWLIFFGRERFYLIIVVSVLVRILTEGFALPAAARAFEFRHAGDLFSIGLVIVPLTANAFWNVGLPRGFRRTGTITLLTWLVVAFVLSPATNLNLNYFEYTYETVALDFFSSPKAYLIILVGAIVGARTNHLFGWDYNGILVPGLLALAWYSPLKLASTLVEAVFVAWVAQQLVLLPPLNRVLMEGPRRTFYVFCVGFISKFFLGHVLGTLLPGMSATDLYGFGYVLPSLVAVKIWQKRNAPRILVPAVGASLTAFVVANLAGYGLHLMMPGIPRAEADAEALGLRGAEHGSLGSRALEWALIRSTAWPVRTDPGQGAAPRLDWVRWLSAHAGKPPPFGEQLNDELRELSLFGTHHGLPDGSQWTVVRGRDGSAPSSPAFLLSHRKGAAGVVLREASPCALDAEAVIESARESNAAVVALVRSSQWSAGWRAALESGLGVPDKPALPAASEKLQEFSAAPEASSWTLDEVIEKHRVGWPGRTHLRRTPASADSLRCFSAQLMPWMTGGSETFRAAERAHIENVASLLGYERIRGEAFTALVGTGPNDLLWIRRHDDGSAPEAVTVPFPEMGLGTLEAGRWLFEKDHAEDLLIGGHAGGYQPDAEDVGGARSHLQRVIELLLARPEQRVVVVRPLPAHHEIPGVDLVMTDGLLSDWSKASWKSELERRIEALGTVMRVDGRDTLFPLRGTGDPMLGYARHFAPGQVLLLWWASKPRSRLLFPAPNSPESGSTP